MFRRLLSSKSARNGLYILFERIISVGATTIVTILSARYLGTENFGILNYGLTLVSLFAGFMKLGIDAIMVNELISNRNREGELLGTSIVLRIVASLLSIISIGALLMVLDESSTLVITVSLIQSVILVFQAVYVLDYWFQSNLASKYVSIAKIIATAITTGYSGYLLVTGKSLEWFAVSTVITGMIVGSTLLVFYKRQGGQKLVFSVGASKYLLARSYHFIIANIISLVYVQVDKVMIGNMLGQHELGIYSAALMLCTAWSFFPEAIITSLRPGVMAAKANHNQKVYLAKLKRLYFVIFWLSAGIAAIIAIAAPILVRLFFGTSFEDAASIVRIAIWYVPFSMLGLARGIWIVCEGKNRFSKYPLILGLIINVALNVFLIPVVGIAGAALSTVITEVASCFIAPLLFKQTREHPRIVVQAIAHRI